MKQIILGAFWLCLYGCSSDVGSASPGASGAGGEAGAQGAVGPNTCSAAREQLLGAIDSISTSEVSVVTKQADVSTLYVGATAGGTADAAMNPWIFVSLEHSSRVAVTDLSSTQSFAWDLALKRPLLYTNSGDGGPGKGGAVLIDKEFDDVTADDAADAEFATEKFFDADCSPIVDETGAAATSFSNWYDYDAEAHTLSPHAGTWLVHGATGKLFKLRIETYYGTPEGGTGMAGGAYLIDVAAL
ncbi:MAG: HmuY family protein [Pseudomonadota bacterium]